MLAFSPRAQVSELVARGSSLNDTDDDGWIPVHYAAQGTLTTGEYSYTGDFERDVIHGEGTFTFASGASYNGSWTNGVYDGAGTYTWSDGTRYEGAWSKGKMHGEGTYTDKAGHQWTGTYYNGMGPGLERLDN